MRKTASVPNFQELNPKNGLLKNLSTESLQMSRSESVSELNSDLHGVSPLKSRLSFGKEAESSPSKPFGLGLTSPANVKISRMTTLHEEQHSSTRKHSLDFIADENLEDEDEDDNHYEKANQMVGNKSGNHTLRRRIPTSRTLESLLTDPPISNTPSTSSSGYGSQAVSSSNLSSEDSVSVKSISIDGTPENDTKQCSLNESKPVEKVQTETFPQGDFSDINNDTNKEEPKQFIPESSHDNELCKDITLIENKVVRRKKSATLNPDRASFPQVTSNPVSTFMEDDRINTTEKSEDDADHYELKADLPDWITIGESVLIRPYNSSGVIAYIGGTEFSGGTWIGVELDAPKGKNDGSVQGVKYFSCKPKHGMFVRADKLILDRRGRAMRLYKTESHKNKCPSKSDNLIRPQSRSDGLNHIGTRSSSKAK